MLVQLVQLLCPSKLQAVYFACTPNPTSTPFGVQPSDLLIIKYTSPVMDYTDS